MPVFSSILSTTAFLGARRYSLQITLTFSRKAGSGLCSHCWTRCGRMSPACKIRCTWPADLPDNAALHGAHHNLVERRRDPSLSFLRFTRQRDQLQPCFLRDARRTTTALAFPNTLHTLPRNALAPLADRLHRHAQFLRNHRIRVALMSQ